MNLEERVAALEEKLAKLYSEEAVEFTVRFESASAAVARRFPRHLIPQGWAGAAIDTDGNWFAYSMAAYYAPTAGFWQLPRGCLRTQIGSELLAAHGFETPDALKPEESWVNAEELIK